MFPLQRGNELVIEFSNGLHPQHKICQDLILENHHLSSPPNNSSNHAPPHHTNHATNSNQHTKKMVHREIERQRRQEMATLNASLRSLLPLEFIKGKRSLSEQMNQVVNYINHLQNNIKELSEKRDELKKKLSDDQLQSHETKHASSSTFTLHHNNGAVGIEATCGLKEEGLPLSKLLELLIEEGLDVVACLSTQVNDRLLHSVQCEVNNSNSVDLSELRRKFSTVFPSFRSI